MSPGASVRLSRSISVASFGTATLLPIALMRSPSTARTTGEMVCAGPRIDKASSPERFEWRDCRRLSLNGDGQYRYPEDGDGGSLAHRVVFPMCGGASSCVARSRAAPRTICTFLRELSARRGHPASSLRS